MLAKEKLDRINALAKKAKGKGLSQVEKKEQEKLRKEYLQNFRKAFRAQLDNIEIIDE